MSLNFWHTERYGLDENFWSLCAVEQRGQLNFSWGSVTLEVSLGVSEEPL